jgi:lambda family phage tail tape measure protein
MGDVGSWVVRSFGSIFSSLGSSISGLIGRVSGMFGGFGGGGGGIFGTIGGILDIFFAEGGVIQNGSKVNKYAKGGLVNSPTMFPMANGMGLMGEAGPEAIMPLTRINGQLGVRAEGGSSTPSIVNVNFTVNTMDARDFDTMLIQKKQLITNIVSSAVRQGNRSLA